MANQKLLSVVAVEDFLGLKTNADNWQPGEALVQENCHSLIPGCLEGRDGLLRVDYANSSASVVGGDVRRAIAYQSPLADYIVHQLSTGVVKAGQVPGIEPTLPTFSSDRLVPPVLISGLTDQAACNFAVTRAGELFITNGIDRPRKWKGIGSAVVAGLDAPDVAPTVVAEAGGNSFTGAYALAYRFGDADGNYSNLSPLATINTSADGRAFLWTNVPIDSGHDSSSRTTLRQLFRSRVGDPSVFYLVATLNDNSTTSYAGDTLSDDDLSNQPVLPLKNADSDTLNANRFVPPPNHKSVAVWFQDRMFYLVDQPYSKGTISATNGSPTLAGSGMSWPSTLAGRNIYITGASRAYPVYSISGTNATLGSALDPLFRWTFDEGAGSATADSGLIGLPGSIVDPHGTIVWSASVPSALSFSSHSLQFDGSNYVQSSSSTTSRTLPMGLSPRTISFWFNPASGALASTGLMFYQGDATNGYGVEFRLSGSKLVAIVNGNKLTGTTTLSAGTYYHAVLTFDGTNATLMLGTSVEVSATVVSASISGTTTVAASSGVATFSGLSINVAGSGYQLVATATGLTQASSNLFNVQARAATQLSITTQPSNTQAGQPISMVVQAKDSNGNLDTGFTGTVSVAIGTNPSSATLSGTTSMAAVAGVATFTNLVLSAAGTGFTLVASYSGLTSATSNTFNSTNGTSTKLAWKVQPPSSFIANQPIDLAVQAQTAGSALDQSYSGTVTLSIDTNPGSGNLTGTLTAQAKYGVAVFKNVSLDTAGSGYKLRVDATGLTGAATGSFNVTVGTEVALVVQTQPPAVAVNGTSFTLRFRYVDAYGNTVTTASHNVTLTLDNNPGSATLSGGNSTGPISGVVTFSGVQLNANGAGYIIRATNDNDSSMYVDTLSFDVGSTLASTLVLKQAPPTTAAPNSTFKVVVTAEDGSGNISPDFNHAVTVSLSANPGGATLSGTLTTTAVSGVAVFDDLALDEVASGYQLSFASTSLATITSSSLAVASNSQARLRFTVQPVNVAAGASFGVTVTAVDANENVATSFSGNVTLTLVAASGADTSQNNRLYVGRGSTPSDFFVGKVDDVRIYDAVLASQAQTDLDNGVDQIVSPINYADTTGSGLSYTILPDPETERNIVYYSESNEPESVSQAQNRVTLQENSNVRDELVGGFALGNSLYLFQRSHCYRMNYIRQPAVDAEAAYMTARGMYNQQCFDITDAGAFVMDRQGAYLFGDDAQSISKDIDNYWRDGLIDNSKSSTFWVRANRKQGVIRFYVCFTGDSGSAPRRALCWNYRLGGRWWLETYWQDMGAGCTVETQAGFDYYVLGASEYIFKQSGVCDSVSSPVTGTLTSDGTATTLIDSNASFTPLLIGAPVFVVHNGVQYQGVVTGCSSGTSLTVSSMTHAAGDTYVVGGVAGTWRSGRFLIPRSDELNARDLNVFFRPTTNAASLAIRHYLNYDTSPVLAQESQYDTGESAVQTQGSGDAVVDMKLTRNALGNNAGFGRKGLSGNATNQTPSDRYLSVELAFVQTSDRVRVSRLELDGVR